MEELLSKCKEASKKLQLLTEDDVNKCLLNIKDALIKNKDFILKENQKDINNAKGVIKDSMIDRLTLNDKRILALASSIDDVISLPFYPGEVIEEIKRPNGLLIKKVRVPFGVIASIFESRPNVSVDISVLGLKTLNAVVLKGGKEAINTNIALCKVMRDAIKDIVDPHVITLIESTNREDTNKLLTMKDYIDLMIPRGSKGLIKYVVENAKIPYIETGAGNCHLYVHKMANIDMALNVIVNAKVQRPSVCNAIENILVDKEIAEYFLPKLKETLDKYNVEIRGCDYTSSIIDCVKASEDDFYEEYNDYIVAVKVVNSLDEAINHINIHSTKHSEAIITEDDYAAARFLNEIDSACLYHNASTRFTDGGEFGFGAEIGISTTKLHARGPMGLKEITTYKYKIYGKGQVRE